jgi:hypothetical protein
MGTATLARGVRQGDGMAVMRAVDDGGVRGIDGGGNDGGSRPTPSSAPVRLRGGGTQVAPSSALA